VGGELAQRLGAEPPDLLDPEPPPPPVLGRLRAGRSPDAVRPDAIDVAVSSANLVAPPR